MDIKKIWMEIRQWELDGNIDPIPCEEIKDLEDLDGYHSWLFNFLNPQNNFGRAENTDF